MVYLDKLQISLERIRQWNYSQIVNKTWIIHDFLELILAKRITIWDSNFQINKKLQEIILEIESIVKIDPVIRSMMLFQLSMVKEDRFSKNRLARVGAII